jgi:hypothetical protein
MADLSLPAIERMLTELRNKGENLRRIEVLKNCVAYHPDKFPIGTIEKLRAECVMKIFNSELGVINGGYRKTKKHKRSLKKSMRRYKMKGGAFERWDRIKTEADLIKSIIAKIRICYASLDNAEAEAAAAAAAANADKRRRNAAAAVEAERRRRNAEVAAAEKRRRNIAAAEEKRKRNAAAAVEAEKRKRNAAAAFKPAMSGQQEFERWKKQQAAEERERVVLAARMAEEKLAAKKQLGVVGIQTSNPLKEMSAQEQTTFYMKKQAAEERERQKMINRQEEERQAALRRMREGGGGGGGAFKKPWWDNE